MPTENKKSPEELSDRDLIDALTIPHCRNKYTDAERERIHGILTSRGYSDSAILRLDRSEEIEAKRQELKSQREKVKAVSRLYSPAGLTVITQTEHRRAIVAGLRMCWESNRLHYWPRIPSGADQAFREHCDIKAGEELIAILDTSFFGDCKEYLALSSHALYHRHSSAVPPCRIALSYLVDQKIEGHTYNNSVDIGESHCLSISDASAVAGWLTCLQEALLHGVELTEEEMLGGITARRFSGWARPVGFLGGFAFAALSRASGGILPGGLIGGAIGGLLFGLLCYWIIGLLVREEHKDTARIGPEATESAD